MGEKAKLSEWGDRHCRGRKEKEKKAFRNLFRQKCPKWLEEEDILY